MQRFRQLLVATILCWMALCAVVLDGATLPPGGVPKACAKTPAEALSVAAGLGAEGLPQPHGYRVAAVRWDALQRQAWAVVESCEHPERPTMSLRTVLPLQRSLLSGTAKARNDVMLPIVRAGDVVRLWKNDGHAQIEMMATSEENGGIGTRIRVLLSKPKDQDGQSAQPQYLAGVVRGPADVELEP